MSRKQPHRIWAARGALGVTLVTALFTFGCSRDSEEVGRKIETIYGRDRRHECSVQETAGHTCHDGATPFLKLKAYAPANAGTLRSAGEIARKPQDTETAVDTLRTPRSTK
jgi:hypothetical protein